MQQKTALDILKSGVNVFLTGSAGTGKTYVLNRYIQYLKEREVITAITASTGIAATHISGQTIHSWSGIGIKDVITQRDLVFIARRKKIKRHIENTKVLIIDEISMLSGKTLENINTVCQYFRQNYEPFGGMQVIFCGDFFQLPPITRSSSVEEKYAFMTPIWLQCDLTICYLTEQYRQEQDDQLQFVLNNIRSSKDQETVREYLHEKVTKTDQPEDIIKLITHNDQADQINNRELQKLTTESKTYVAETYGDDSIVKMLKNSVLAPEKLEIKIGSKVMFVRNKPEAGYQNGTLGIVIDFDDRNYPIIKANDGRTLRTEPEEWLIEDEGIGPIASYEQIPLRLAWAITVHKSQGMTLEQAYIDLSHAFEPGQGYVALSRVRDWKGLFLHDFNEVALKLDPLAMKADIRFRELSKSHGQAFDGLSENQQTKLQTDFIKRCEGTTDTSAIQENKQRLKEKKTLEKIAKKTTLELTKELVDTGASFDEVCKQRNLKKNTIISHIEQMITSGQKVSIDLPLPDPNVVEEIVSMIEELRDTKSSDFIDEKGLVRLGALHHALDGAYSYEDLRIVRLHSILRE